MSEARTPKAVLAKKVLTQAACRCSRVVERCRQQRCKGIRHNRLVRLLPINQAAGQDSHRTGATLGIHPSAHAIHGKPEFGPRAHECGNGVGQWHRERSTKPGASIAQCDRGPGAGAQPTVHFHHPSFNADPYVGVEPIARRTRAGLGALHRFGVAPRLIAHP